ncbi:MAG: 6-pyruvoyl-tetrahydropterin synthase-related protein [Coleofasciculaceae cyanobacterium]
MLLVNKTQRINILAILVIFMAGIILILPTIAYGVFDAHDILVHLNWANYFSQQLWAGELYPRWLLNMNSGLGSPTFFFYPPIPYYFTSLFYPFRFGNPSIWTPLVLSSTLALILSGFTAYLWLKNITNQKSALIGSIVYMILPYHWTIDFYWRFAFSEYWAFVWIPLVLYYTKKIVCRHKFAVLGLAISYALLSMTHLPTTLIFSVIPFTYILFIAQGKQKLRSFVYLILALVLGIGLAAIYLIPALSMQENVLLKEIATEPHFYFANNFTWRKQFIYPNFEIFMGYLGILVILMAIISYLAFTVARKNFHKNIRLENFYWLTIALASSLMTLPLSKPLWKLFNVLQVIQFPWRFNVVLTVATTALITLGCYSLKPKYIWQQKKILIATGLLFLLIISGFAMASHNIERLKFNQQTLIRMSQDAPEYRPKWVAKKIFDQDLVHQLAQNTAKAQITKGQGSLAIKKWQPRKIILQTNAPTNIEITLKQFYYPGWSARVDYRKISVQPSQPEGLVKLEIPSGKHQVKITLEAGLKERLGQAISTASVLILLLLFLPFPGFIKSRKQLKLWITQQKLSRQV